MVSLLENSLQRKCTLSEIPTMLKVRMEMLFEHLRLVDVNVKAGIYFQKLYHIVVAHSFHSLLPVASALVLEPWLNCCG